MDALAERLARRLASGQTIGGHPVPWREFLPEAWDLINAILETAK